ncbi:MAG: hypothetical protein WCF68_18560 [Terriglobales bacterium]
MKRFLWLGFVLFLELICVGCGDTFRPIIIPNPPTFPNPAAAHTVVSINDNGTVVNGSAMVIDVSGDTDVSIANVGLAPVHAVQQSASVILVANRAVTGQQADSLTKLSFSGTTIAINPPSITLPANSAPNFVATTESSQAYVLLSNLASVGVINTNTDVLVNTFPVGNNPVAMAETPNGQKLYVANQADNTISAFNTLTGALSSRTISGSFNAPIWVSARSDSQRAYVLNGNGVVSTIDTSGTAGPDPVIDASVSAPGAAYMVYDGNLNRLYIPGGTQLTILDVSQSIPQVITGGPIAIPTAAPSLRTASDPCALTRALPLTVAAVAALPDGSSVYVGAYYEDTSGNICPQVTAIDVPSSTVKTPSIAIPGFPAYDAFCSTTRFRITMAAGGDSSRAYLASCDGGMVNIINTSTNTYILNQPEPIGTRAPNSENPVFLLAGP